MASFDGIALDPNVEENKGAGFTVITPGYYVWVIVKDAIKSAKTGNGKVWKLRLQIVEGDFTGETIDDNINIKNKSQKCQAIGQGTLKRICILHGVAYPPASTEGLIGLPFGGKVINKEFKSNTSGKMILSNVIKGYCTADEAREKAKSAPVVDHSSPAQSQGSPATSEGATGGEDEEW